MFHTFRGRVDDVEVRDLPLKKDAKEGDKPEQRIQLTISTPGKKSEPLQFSFDPAAVENAPTLDQMEEWSMDSAWVVIESDGMTMMKGKTDDREWTMISFGLTAIRAMTPQEKTALTKTRTQVKASRKKAAAEKKAAKQSSDAKKAA